VVVFLSFIVTCLGIRPVVLWHGMGDTCCYPFSMGAIKDQIQTILPGTYVHSIELGGNIVADEIEGFLGDVDDQIQEVCQQLAADYYLSGGFNAVGFSQGGQFLRAYVERCNNPPVYNLVTMGGQHQGIAELPQCTAANWTICEFIQQLMAYGAYNPIVQSTVVQAQYFQDPLDYASFLKYNHFLTDINNLININGTYKQNLLTLNSLVLVQFIYDTVVVPRISEWFGEFQPGNVNRILQYNETQVYLQDTIGLKELDVSGRLKFVGCPGNHMQFTLDWFTQNVIVPYFNNTASFH